MSSYQTYGRLDGPVVMIGFDSIGRGALPLILRHLKIEPAQITVVAPDDANGERYAARRPTRSSRADSATSPIR